MDPYDYRRQGHDQPRNQRRRPWPPPHSSSSSNRPRSRSRDTRGAAIWTLTERRHVQRSGLWVQTNALRVRVLPRQQQQQQQPLTWYVYRVDIFHVNRRLRGTHQDGSHNEYVLEKIPEDNNNDPDLPITYRMVDNTVRTPLTQQICRALTQVEPRLIADGSEVALSMEPIVLLPQGTNETTTTTMITTTRTFELCLPRGTTPPNDPDAPYVDTKWWLVELTPWSQNNGATIQLNDILNTVMRGRLENIERCLTTALRSSCLGMPSFGRNPRQAHLHIPLQFRPDVLGGSLAKRWTPRNSNGSRTGEARPAVAIRSTACVNQDNSLVVKANVLLDHVLPDRLQEYLHPQSLKGRIPLLDPQAGTLAGVKVRLDQVVPPSLQVEIAERLKKLTLEIRYQKSIQHGGWIKKMREEGKAADQQWLDKNKWMIRKKKRLYKKDPTDMIVWDPSKYHFNWNGRDITVKDNFKQYYGIELKYPHMPLIRTSREERFPSEFIFQGLSGLTTASANKTDDCIKFFDCFSGTRRLSHINEVAKISGLLQHDGTGALQQAFARLGLGIETTQEKMKAEVLGAPELRFHQHARSIEIADGSWRVQNQRFLRGSRLHSFAVVRLTPSIRNADVETLFNRLQDTFEETGVQLSFNNMSEHLVSNIVELSPASVSSFDSSQQWDRAVDEAKARRWQCFHSGGRGIALVRHNWGEDGQIATVRECILKPNPDPQARDPILALPIDRRKVATDSGFCSARFYIDSGEVTDDRIRDIRWDTVESSFVLLPENPAVTVKALRYRQQHDEIPCGVVRDDFYISVKKRQLAYPTLLFVLCSDKLPSSVYNEMKWACEKRGLQSQCIRMDKFMNFHQQRSGDSAYLSNLALKLNGKASSNVTRAAAWAVPELESSTSGMLIIGYTMSSGPGLFGRMVVCASCLLDGGSMRFSHSAMVQDKDAIVAATVMKQITKNLYQQWTHHSGRRPKRILFFRNGGNDGSFKDIVDTEVKAIRQELTEIVSLSQDQSKDGNGPALTFVVTQSNHNLVIAPDDARHQQSNVPAGTSLRESNILPRTHYFETVHGHDGNLNAMDFFLTAHQGLKGTSKPLLYRCLVNDDSTKVPLNGDALRRVTYLLSFQYGTAPKAVREVSVLRYSLRQTKRMHIVLDRLVERFREMPPGTHDNGVQAFPTNAWIRPFRDRDEARFHTIYPRSLDNRVGIP